MGNQVEMETGSQTEFKMVGSRMVTTMYSTLESCQFKGEMGCFDYRKWKAGVSFSKSYGIFFTPYIKRTKGEHSNHLHVTLPGP